MNVILKLNEHGDAVSLSMDENDVSRLTALLASAVPVFSTHDGYWHESDRPCMPTLIIVRDEALVPRAPTVNPDAKKTKVPSPLFSGPHNPDDLKI